MHCPSPQAENFVIFISIIFHLSFTPQYPSEGYSISAIIQSNATRVSMSASFHSFHMLFSFVLFIAQVQRTAISGLILVFLCFMFTKHKIVMRVEIDHSCLIYSFTIYTELHLLILSCAIMLLFDRNIHA